MAISKKLLEEFKKIVRDDYGKELSDAQAEEITYTLVRYFDLLAKIKYRMDHSEKKWQA